MNKFIFCLLLLPILLVGVCAVSASSDLDADVSDVCLYSPLLDDHVAVEHVGNGHVAIEPIESTRPGAHGPAHDPLSEGYGSGDNILIPIIPIENARPGAHGPCGNGSVPFEIIDDDSNNQGSDSPSMDIPVIDNRPGSDVPVAEGESFGTIPHYFHRCTVDDSNMEVFPYYPFGPHYAPVIGPCINPEHGFSISPRF